MSSEDIDAMVSRLPGSIPGNNVFSLDTVICLILDQRSTQSVNLNWEKQRHLEKRGIAAVEMVLMSLFCWAGFRDNTTIVSPFLAVLLAGCSPSIETSRSFLHGIPYISLLLHPECVENFIPRDLFYIAVEAGRLSNRMNGEQVVLDWMERVTEYIIPHIRSELSSITSSQLSDSFANRRNQDRMVEKAMDASTPLSLKQLRRSGHPFGVAQDHKEKQRQGNLKSTLASTSTPASGSAGLRLFWDRRMLRACHPQDPSSDLATWMTR
ncbi:hypothetical protein C8J56DRAFT_197583 [Mycena floridula]|nr:hypothetical protein C8J56DRAFT_197583 [Mycena floridula]